MHYIYKTICVLFWFSLVLFSLFIPLQVTPLHSSGNLDTFNCEIAVSKLYNGVLPLCSAMTVRKRARSLRLPSQSVHCSSYNKNCCHTTRSVRNARITILEVYGKPQNLHLSSGSFFRVGLQVTILIKGMQRFSDIGKATNIIKLRKKASTRVKGKNIYDYKTCMILQIKNFSLFCFFFVILQQYGSYKCLLRTWPLCTLLQKMFRTFGSFFPDTHVIQQNSIDIKIQSHCNFTV